LGRDGDAGIGLGEPMKGGAMAMWARIIRSETPLDKVDLAVKLINDEVIPTAKKVPGVKNIFWFGDRSTGKGITIVLHESEQTLKESEDSGKQIRRDVAKKIGLTFHEVERYELLAKL
jgi:hypothetical protein